jgi:hypothetical protein
MEVRRQKSLNQAWWRDSACDKVHRPGFSVCAEDCYEE